MGNVVLNKPIIQSNLSSYVMPYSSARAVDGVTQPLNRWLSNKVPCEMVVDLKGQYYINGWNVVNMAGLSGWGSQDYVLQSYNLQVSMDNVNWRIVDSVINNTLANTSRTFTYTNAKFVKVSVSNGLRANPKVASIVELQVFGELCTSALLTNLTLESGVLSPSFSPTGLAYTSQVNSEVSSITLTPTAQDANAIIKVNGTVVTSGSASSSINLTPNAITPITIEVTPTVGEKVVYTVNVTRCSNAQLDSIKFFPIAVKLNETFSSTNYNYTVTTTQTSFKLTPNAKDTNAKIMVNGVQVASGAQAQINTGGVKYTIQIVITPTVGTLPTTYTVVVN